MLKESGQGVGLCRGYSSREVEIRRRLNSGNASYRSVLNLLSCRLLSTNVRIGIYKTIILPVIL
jgi:hypothetical protein